MRSADVIFLLTDNLEPSSSQSLEESISPTLIRLDNFVTNRNKSFTSKITVRNIDEILYQNHQQETNVLQEDDNIVANEVSNTSNSEGSDVSQIEIVIKLLF